MNSPAPAPANDLIQPFQVERYGLRGRLVRLGGVASDVLSRHDYPEPVAVMLGQMMAVAAILAGALKYDGVFTLQTQGDGPIRLMVADITSTGDVRAYAQYDAERLARLSASSPDGAVGGSVPHLLGNGYLAFTVDQGPDTERYQGYRGSGRGDLGRLPASLFPPIGTDRCRDQGGRQPQPRRGRRIGRAK